MQEVLGLAQRFCKPLADGSYVVRVWSTSVSICQRLRPTGEIKRGAIEPDSSFTKAVTVMPTGSVLPRLRDVQDSLSGLSFDSFKAVPATVIIHGDPASFFCPVEPIFVLLKVNLLIRRFPDV